MAETRRTMLKEGIFMEEHRVPQGFAMALSQNEAAVNAYAMMTVEKKEEILEQAHRVRSKRQMQKLVDSLARDQIT